MTFPLKTTAPRPPLSAIARLCARACAPIRTAALAALALFAAALAPGAASATDITNMTREERTAFGQEVRRYLMENPEVIVEVIRELEKRQAEAKTTGDATLIAANADRIFHDGISWVGGNPEGDVTIVEYSDYRCPYCRRARAEVEDLLRKDGNIRFILKEYPILGPDSTFASKVAVSALRNLGPEAYAKVHDALMEYNGPWNEKAMRRLLAHIGVDADKVLTGMEDPAVEEHLGRILAEGRKLGIDGTPTFIIGDTFVRGYAPEEAIARIVEDVRKRGAGDPGRSGD